VTSLYLSKQCVTLQRNRLVFIIILLTSTLLQSFRSTKIKTNRLKTVLPTTRETLVALFYVAVCIDCLLIYFLFIDLLTYLSTCVYHITVSYVFSLDNFYFTFVMCHYTFIYLLIYLLST